MEKPETRLIESEKLINIVIERMVSLQKGPLSCGNKESIIYHLDSALECFKEMNEPTLKRRR